MTPKEKCDELIKKYKPIVTLKMGFEHSYILKKAVQCALIAVDEIITSNPIKFDENEDCIGSYWWKEVKQEIEKYNQKQHIINIMKADEDDGLYDYKNNPC
jgi:hypothetical protein